MNILRGDELNGYSGGTKGTESPGKSEVIESSIPKETLENIKLPQLHHKLIKRAFNWDGTYLGVITDNQILLKLYANKFEYWIIWYNGFISTFMIKLSKFYNQCLVDELKPLFGLSKLGTHYATYKDKYVILSRARTTIDNRFVVSDYTLNTGGTGGTGGAGGIIDPSLMLLVPKIREIYVFRDLLGLTKSTDSCIAIRRSDTSNNVYPVSLIDSHIKPERLIDLSVSTYLPDTVFNKWFKDESPTAILKKMCGLVNPDKVTNIVFKIRGDIETTVKRVCGNEFLDLPDMITARISQKLQHL